MKKKKKVTIKSKTSSTKGDSFNLITEKNKTFITSSHGLVGVVLAIPLIGAFFYGINLLDNFFAPVPKGVQAAPIPISRIFTLIAFMAGYSIFLGLYYFSKRKTKKKKKSK